MYQSFNLILNYPVVVNYLTVDQLIKERQKPNTHTPHDSGSTFQRCFNFHTELVSQNQLYEPKITKTN